MQRLTKKQAAVLHYIKEFIEQEGIPPSVRKLRDRFAYKSNNAVINHLRALEKKGCIQRKNFGHRALEIVNFNPGKHQLPVLGTIAAGTPILAKENYDEFLELNILVPRSENEFILRVKGDSMIGAQIRDGDFALIRPQPTAENGQIVAVLIDDEATLKFYYRHRSFIELRPANPKYEPIIYRESHVETLSIIGRLVSIIRNYS